MKSPRQVPTSTHHCLLESPSLTSRGGKLEDGHRARAAYESARRHPAAQFDDDPAIRVEEDQVELEEHADGMAAPAARNQQPLAGTRARQEGQSQETARHARR